MLSARIERALLPVQRNRTWNARSVMPPPLPQQGASAGQFRLGSAACALGGFRGTAGPGRRADRPEIDAIAIDRPFAGGEESFAGPWSTIFPTWRSSRWLRLPPA